jgi:hypothetical protein
MPKITEVKPVAKYRLWLRFADGTTGEVDLSHLAGKGVFQIWEEPGGFDRVAIGSGGEVQWGEQVDLCPDALYLRVTGMTPEELFPALSESHDHARA